MPSEPLIAWDTSVMLALLKDEQRPNDEMDGVYEWARRVDQGEARLLLSIIVRIEVLDSQISSEAAAKFQQMLLRSNVMEVELGPQVAEKARELRDYYQQRRAAQGGPGLSTPDSIHLATAILYDADAIHTFDELNNRRSLGLIPLSGNVAGHDLVVCKPPATQYELKLVKDEPTDGNAG